MLVVSLWHALGGSSLRMQDDEVRGLPSSVLFVWDVGWAGGGKGGVRTGRVGRGWAAGTDMRDRLALHAHTHEPTHTRAHTQEEGIPWVHLISLIEPSHDTTPLKTRGQQLVSDIKMKGEHPVPTPGNHHGAGARKGGVYVTRGHVTGKVTSLHAQRALWKNHRTLERDLLTRSRDSSCDTRKFEGVRGSKRLEGGQHCRAGWGWGW